MDDLSQWRAEVRELCPDCGRSRQVHIWLPVGAPAFDQHRRCSTCQLELNLMWLEERDRDRRPGYG